MRWADPSARRQSCRASAAGVSSWVCALDGRATGASHRTLAQGLFGADRVPTGPSWKTHDLRSRTLRLLVDAGRLRDGGYRNLLTAGPALRLR